MLEAVTSSVPPRLIYFYLHFVTFCTKVDAASEPSGYIPLHLACLTGHVGVVGLLLSRSTELLKVETTSKDIGLRGKKLE